MKKVFCIKISVLFMAVSFLFILSGCSSAYKGWQEITLYNCGTFQVPGDWVITEQEGYLYLSDLPLEAENAQVYLVQQTYEEVSFDDEAKVLANEVNPEWEAYKPKEEVYSEVFSNNAICTKDRYPLAGQDLDLYSITFTNLEITVRFLAPDPALDEKTIIKIAKSFEMLANG